jgi:hypothetical protein
MAKETEPRVRSAQEEKKAACRNLRSGTPQN